MADLRADTERFTFEVDGLDEELRVVRFRGAEGISRLFRFEVTLAAETSELDFEQVLDKPAVLVMEGADAPRFVHGIVSRLELAGQIGRFTLYDATLVPAVWRLKLRHDCRIFQDQAVPDIVKKVLDEAGVPADTYRFEDLSYERAQRTYTVQYRESDWDFIARLLEEEGIFHFFEHTDAGCVLVMGDVPAHHPTIEGDPDIPYAPSAGRASDAEHLTRFAYAEEVRTGKVTLTDYNFIQPTMNLARPATGERFTDLEVYDYPGGYLDETVGEKRAATVLGEQTTPQRTASGESVSPRLVPGFQFTPVSHDAQLTSPFLDTAYTITALFSTGEQPQVLEEAAGGSAGYGNRFEAIPGDVAFLPPRVTPKPVVEGPQTAVVVGPSDEEIYTDEYGRVKVQFHWDRVGAMDDKSSCWIRVSQLWAGAGWGGIHIPRKGQEVVVDFLEGDPDRPIVTGRVYHGQNRPPYKLPDNRTQSGIKSNSSPDGDGSNELRFEDQKGKEEVFIHAQKDMTVAVENDRSITVGGNDTLHVTKKREVIVDGDEGASFTATGPCTVSTSNEYSLTASSKITLTVGGSSITIEGGSITLASAAVHITGETTIDGATTVNGETTVNGTTGINGDTTIDGGSVDITGSGGVNVNGATINLN